MWIGSVSTESFITSHNSFCCCVGFDGIFRTISECYSRWLWRKTKGLLRSNSYFLLFHHLLLLLLPLFFLLLSTRPVVAKDDILYTFIVSSLSTLLHSSVYIETRCLAGKTLSGLAALCKFTLSLVICCIFHICMFTFVFLGGVGAYCTAGPPCFSVANWQELFFVQVQ